MRRVITITDLVVEQQETGQLGLVKLIWTWPKPAYNDNGRGRLTDPAAGAAAGPSMPQKYDYHRALPPQGRVNPTITLSGGTNAGAAPAAAPVADIETEEGGVECVICLNTVDVTGDARARMVTPCHHVFHTGCLTRWVDVKQECPTCRRPLPPP